MNQYILRHRKPIPCDDLVRWARWFARSNRRVRRTYIGPYMVSTVFLGMDHAPLNKEGPHLFETMVFDKDRKDIYMRRCGTHRQALKMHWEAVEWTKKL